MLQWPAGVGYVFGVCLLLWSVCFEWFAGSVLDC